MNENETVRYLVLYFDGGALQDYEHLPYAEAQLALTDHTDADPEHLTPDCAFQTYPIYHTVSDSGDREAYAFPVSATAEELAAFQEGIAKADALRRENLARLQTLSAAVREALRCDDPAEGIEKLATFRLPADPGALPYAPVVYIPSTCPACGSGDLQLSGKRVWDTYASQSDGDPTCTDAVTPGAWAGPVTVKCNACDGETVYPDDTYPDIIGPFTVEDIEILRPDWDTVTLRRFLSEAGREAGECTARVVMDELEDTIARWEDAAGGEAGA